MTMKIKLENGTIIDGNKEAFVLIFDDDDQVVDVIETLSAMKQRPENIQRKLAIFPAKWGNKKKKQLFMEKGQTITNNISMED